MKLVNIMLHNEIQVHGRCVFTCAIYCNGHSEEAESREITADPASWSQGRSVKGNTWLVLTVQGSPTVSKLERNLSWVTAIVIEGFGETCLGRSYAIVTTKTHGREAMSHPLALPQASLVYRNSYSAL